MKSLIITLCTFVVTATCTFADPSSLAQIQAEMRALQFDKAIALADQAIAAKDAAADQALFLKATALFQGKKFADAVTAADQADRGFSEIRLASQGGLPQGAGIDRAEEIRRSGGDLSGGIRPHPLSGAQAGTRR